jgi:cytochrome c biogenesis protein CcdA
MAACLLSLGAGVLSLLSPCVLPLLPLVFAGAFARHRSPCSPSRSVSPLRPRSSAWPSRSSASPSIATWSGRWRERC